MQTTSRFSSSSEETRARILAAAKVIYEQNGTRGTTTRVVAERAGVNEATVFRHFGSKHALLQAMRENACPIVIFEGVLASLTGDMRSDLRAIALSLAQRMHDQRAMLCISLAEEVHADPDPEWRGPIQILSRLEEYFDGQIRLGRVRGESKRMAAFFLGMCFSYVVARKLWDSYVINVSDIDGLVDIFLNGVK